MKNEAKVRRALRAKFGSRKYRITADGEVHANGVMPNTNLEGWYLLGDVKIVAKQIEHGFF